MTKSIGCGLLTFAVFAAVVLAQESQEQKPKWDAPVEGKWTFKPGSGLNFDAGDTFSFNLANQLQFQWAFTVMDNDPDTNNFRIRRARTSLSGHAFSKNLLYLIRLDHGDTNGSLKDGWAQYNFVHGDTKEERYSTIGLRVGQSKPYHGLEATGSSSGLFFVERSAATRALSDERSRGAWVHGIHSLSGPWIRWTAGAQNGDVAVGSTVADKGEATDNPDHELTYVASVNVDPFGDFVGGGKSYESFRQGTLNKADKLVGTIGVGVMVGNHRTPPDKTTGFTKEVESTSVNLNTAWRMSRLGLQGEVFLRSDESETSSDINTRFSEDSLGWYAQGSWTMEKPTDSDMQWGFGLRVGRVAADDTNGSAANGKLDGITGFAGLGSKPGDATEVTGVLNAFYHGHAAKTQIEYTWQRVDLDTGTDSTNHIIRIQFQLLF